MIHKLDMAMELQSINFGSPEQQSGRSNPVKDSSRDQSPNTLKKTGSCKIHWKSSAYRSSTSKVDCLL